MIKVQFRNRSNQLLQSGYTVEEEADLYDRQLKDVLENLTWYMANVEKLAEYRVRWKNYKHRTPTVPHKYVKKQEGL